MKKETFLFSYKKKLKNEIFLLKVVTKRKYVYFFRVLTIIFFAIELQKNQYQVIEHKYINRKSFISEMISALPIIPKASGMSSASYIRQRSTAKKNDFARC